MKNDALQVSPGKTLQVVQWLIMAFSALFVMGINMSINRIVASHTGSRATAKDSNKEDGGLVIV